MGRGAGGGGGPGGIGRAPRLGERYVGGSDLRGALPSIPFSPADARSHELRKERIREGLRRGQRSFGGPIDLTVDRKGNVRIESGRHRVEVLREPEFRRVRLPARFRRGKVQ